MEYFFWPWSFFLLLASSADPDEMQHYAAFHLGLHCFQKYLFGVSSIHRVKVNLSLNFVNFSACIAKVADVVFVVDTSGSIGRPNFERIKEFIKDVVLTFDVDYRYTRVGLIEFSTTPKIEFKLFEKNNITELLDAIDNITYSGGGTSTSDALELMRLEGFERYLDFRRASVSQNFKYLRISHGFSKF